MTPPEDGDGVWKTQDHIRGSFALFLQDRGELLLTLEQMFDLGFFALVLTSGQAQGSGKVLSWFLLTLRKLRDFKQCMTVVGKLLRRLSGTSSSSSLRRPIQLVAAEGVKLNVKKMRKTISQTQSYSAIVRSGAGTHQLGCQTGL